MTSHPICRWQTNSFQTEKLRGNTQTIKRKCVCWRPIRLWEAKNDSLVEKSATMARSTPLQDLHHCKIYTIPGHAPRVLVIAPMEEPSTIPWDPSLRASRSGSEESLLALALPTVFPVMLMIPSCILRIDPEKRVKYRESIGMRTTH
jgi:hypothetical protein